MALTKEMSDKLKDFFPVNAHEFLKGACYITEEQITDRLDEVDPSWTFEKQSIIQRDKRIIATYRLTVGGAYRDGVGMETIQYGKGQDGSKPTDYEVNEAEKSAATDALKRSARLFGIGRYILTMGNAVSDPRSLSEWLAKQRKINPQTGEIKLVQNGAQKPQEAALSDLQGSMDDLTSGIETPVKSPSERLGTPPKQTIAPRAGKWAFDRNALLTQLSTWAQDTSYQERGNTVKAMDTEGAFAECADIGEAVQLVVARLATHKKAAVS